MSNNGRNYTGSIESTAITLSTGVWHKAFIHFDELTATAGTVVVTMIPPGLTEEKTYTDSTYTVGTTIGIKMDNGAFGSIVLTPSGVDAAMTYGVYVTDL